MKKLSRMLTAILLLATIGLTVGCEKVDNPVISELEISPDYVPIDWEEATLISSDDSAGTYQIQFSGTVPDIHPGSIITIDEDTVVYHRFVTEANVSGNTMNITSTEAYLTDIFANTGFTLSTVAEGKSKAKGLVYYPEEAFVVEEDGTLRALDYKNRKGDTRFTHDLWDYELNQDGQELLSGEHYSIYMEKLNFTYDLDMEMYMNFSGRNVREIVDDALERYKSQALEISASLVGTAGTEQMIRFDIERNCEYSQGYELWKPRLFRPLHIKFVVGTVPVVLKLDADLYREVELTAVGQISAYTGFANTTETRLGFEWSQADGMTPVVTYSDTTEYTPPTVEGRGLIQATAWFFPRIRVLLYDVVGPSFDIKPYLKTTLSGGFREQMLGQTNDYCAWSLDIDAGIDACCGLSLEFIGYEIGNWSTDDWNIFEYRLFHSPQRVVHASGSPTVGQSTQVDFYVFDMNYLLNTEVLTCMPQIVKFEADGLLSSEYGIARQGVASVTWTPSSANDVLYAKLYDINGNVIAMDAVNASPASIAQLVTGSNFNLAFPTSATAVRFEYNSNVSSGTLLSTSSSSVPIYGNMQGNTWVVSTSASTINANPNCKYMFKDRTGLTSIDFGNGFNTSSVTDMSYMFRRCSGLTSLNVPNFNNSSVTNMSHMFYGCSGLTSLNLSNFNTSSVTNMECMFYGCSGLTSLDLSNFNTANVTNMSCMFRGCIHLTGLNLSNFNTSSVTDMSAMFYGCRGLTSLDVSNFNTSSVTNMSHMFSGCGGLTSLNLSNFNTSSVTNMGGMFSECYDLTSLNLSNFNTSSVTNMGACSRDAA